MDTEGLRWGSAVDPWQRRTKGEARKGEAQKEEMLPFFKETSHMYMCGDASRHNDFLHGVTIIETYTCACIGP